MEDLDWCYRFWQRGWKVFYDPAAIALHVKGGSSGERRRPRQEIAFHRGMGRFFRKFYAPRRSPLVNVAVYLGIYLKLALSLGITFAGRALGGHRAK
jgi:GT2 family glycosyltransferase